MPNTSSLDILSATSVMADDIARNRRMRSGRALWRGYDMTARVKGFGVLQDERETVAANVLTSICGSVLSMLLKIVAKVTPSAVVSCSHEIDAQVIWNLVHSSWILQINYNKQRVALIAALLSSFCHLFYILCYLMMRACIKEAMHQGH